MKEEQKIRVRAEFGVEMRRIRVERDRTRLREFLVCFNWDGCPQSAWHPVYIGWGGLALIGLIKSVFRSSNQIRSVHTGLTSVSRFRNLESSKSHNFLIQSPI
jgi:hypothetical protein